MVKGERLSGVAANGTISTLAGKFGEKGFEGNGEKGPKARFNGMHNLAVGPKGVVLPRGHVEQLRPHLRPQGPASSGPSPAPARRASRATAGQTAQFGGVYCVAFDPDKKNLYITDLDNHRIRKVDMATGIVTTVAGNGQKGVPKEGEEAVKQPLVDPRAHAVDADGNLWILERGGHMPAWWTKREDSNRRRDGQGGHGDRTSSPSRDERPQAPLHRPRWHRAHCRHREPSHRPLQSQGRNRSRLVAGTGKKGTPAIGGDPLKAELSQPHGVTVHPKTGDIYISDASNGRVLKIVRE